MVCMCMPHLWLLQWCLCTYLTVWLIQWCVASLCDSIMLPVYMPYCATHTMVCLCTPYCATRTMMSMYMPHCVTSTMKCKVKNPCPFLFELIQQLCWTIQLTSTIVTSSILRSMSTGSFSPSQSNNVDVSGLEGSVIHTDDMLLARLIFWATFSSCLCSMQ
jgi:hypothetical protein